MGERDPTGGSVELANLIDRYGEFLLPDLKRYYGIDLVEMALDLPPHSPRYVLAHIHNLDYDSASVAEMRGGQQFRGWDAGRYQIAALTDAVRVSNYLFLIANRDPKKQKPAAPEPSYTPDQTVKPKKKTDQPGQFGWIARAHLAAQKKHKEGGR